MIKFLEEEEEAKIAKFAQCRFGLRSEKSFLHKKGTQMATSSSSVQARLDLVRCTKDPIRQHVIGGKRITSLAGHYPIKLAKAMASAMEEELMKEGKQHDILVGEQEEHSDDGVQDVPSESSDEEPFAPNSNLPKISPAIRHAVRRLHENTGHRSNRRLARALMIANAPPEVVRAAKEHRCSICQERKAPKPQRPMSLPVPKEVFDQVHIDLLEEWDCQGVRYYIVHMIDHASRFQMGQVLPTRAQWKSFFVSNCCNSLLLGTCKHRCATLHHPMKVRLDNVSGYKIQTRQCGDDLRYFLCSEIRVKSRTCKLNYGLG